MSTTSPNVFARARSALRREPFRSLTNTAIFASVIGITASVIGVACWSLGIGVLQTDVVASLPRLMVATFMPTFVGAWAFYVARRAAWADQAGALLVGGGAAALGVLLHDRLLRSAFYLAPDDHPLTMLNQWVEHTIVPLPSPLIDTSPSHPLYVAVIAGAAATSWAFQRWATAERRRRRR